MTTAMVTARVDADRKRDAEKVLKRNGRTYSDLIRDLTDYMADTGELPEFEKATLALMEERERRRKLEIIEYFANRHLPAVKDGTSDEELLARERMARFGEGAA
ncbi:type II toxin-antitoxin system RelB/DinJ family antitoxin [Bifidobacterium sp. CP2]|uniref:type II toxin-antitoxin system RelB/DinJ family antitoxin n=1 Tax=Bifidobacterium TaxID=1678 RepID=UPI001BDCDF38|nr:MULTISPECIES: type II toxin-antitoxin system RelB/DinJ family antitoxin [Bifidobacterium]MBT1182029.1 type II toxin-antitoxin system RelB/DinJ family antitoxin [Bifidobacterium sp. CP2]MBW3080738.1 type II toxin-antitoxin system RelB/DinJ family antitoxin [Bifidobacterium saguinibicoloris]